MDLLCFLRSGSLVALILILFACTTTTCNAEYMDFASVDQNVALWSSPLVNTYACSPSVATCTQAGSLVSSVWSALALNMGTDTFTIYPLSPTSTNWVETLYYVETFNWANAQLYNFFGQLVQNNLVAGYSAFAFVKEYDPVSLSLLGSASAALSTSGSFSVTLALHAQRNFTKLQYGFVVKGASPSVTALGSVAIRATTVYKMDYGQTWLGYLNTFASQAASSQPALLGKAYQLTDLPAVLTSSQVTLSPCTVVWNATDPFWVTGSSGAKWMEANSYVDGPSAVSGYVTFGGFVNSVSLSAPYVVSAFIAEFNSSGYGIGFVGRTTVPLVANELFSVTRVIPSGGSRFQFGLVLAGPNANPATAASLGSASVATRNRHLDLMLDYAFYSATAWAGFCHAYSYAGGSTKASSTILYRQTSTLANLPATATTTKLTLGPSTSSWFSGNSWNTSYSKVWLESYFSRTAP